MSVANIESGGYDYEPVTEVSKDLSCVICFKLMRNPVQFNCGHGMCSSCYNDLVKNTEDRYAYDVPLSKSMQRVRVEHVY